jgi:cyanophycinase
MVSFGSQAVQFAPGLGIINRMALDGEVSELDAAHRAARLTAVVAYNPFLIGLALDPDTGAVVYPDSTMEIFGAGRGILVDGWQITHTNVAERAGAEALVVEGAQMHALTHGCTYQLDQHEVRQPRNTEIPETGYERFSSF